MFAVVLEQLRVDPFHSTGHSTPWSPFFFLLEPWSFIIAEQQTLSSFAFRFDVTFGLFTGRVIRSERKAINATRKETSGAASSPPSSTDRRPRMLSVARWKTYYKNCAVVWCYFFSQICFGSNKTFGFAGRPSLFLYCQLDFAQAKTIVFRFPFDRLPRRFDHVRFDRDVRVLSALSGLSFYFLFSFFSRFVIVWAKAFFLWLGFSPIVRNSCRAEGNSLRPFVPLVVYLSTV